MEFFGEKGAFFENDHKRSQMNINNQNWSFLQKNRPLIFGGSIYLTILFGLGYGNRPAEPEQLPSNLKARMSILLIDCCPPEK